ncbi:alpha/beta fold hydrolase [Corynebacterium durum]|uniref:alpha/beta fold hydrolase n=2 Tax=Corynebacterium durum TaxID=61592 RepID=UPI0015C91BBE|nr:alpha/beta fold hydrolase [Corynebacterium durum]NYI74901.1 pimeloyl-ACP methyl ester carboxylesterase [Corynebacterium durum]WJY84037.1 Tripeptidyl aminopeptidase precursor [Corynebacterium durum]
MRNLRTIIAAVAASASLAAMATVSIPAQAEPVKRPAITQEDCPEYVNKPGTSCGRMDVPMDYSNPDGKKISVGFIKAAATKPEKRRGVLFINPGGPGGSVYHQFTTVEGYPDTTPRWPKEVREEWDIVGVQPRGLEGSTKLECEEVNAGPIDQIQRSGGLIKDACDAKMPGYAATLTTENTARDWDQVRQAMREEKISIYGNSYGTVLGSMYATTFPEHTDKVVLDSGYNPDNDHSEQVDGFRKAAHDFFGWVSQHDDVYHMGTTPRAVYKSWAERVRQETGVTPTFPPPAAEEEDLPDALGSTGSIGTEAMTRVDPTAVKAEGLLTQLTHPGSKQNQSASMQLLSMGLSQPALWPWVAGKLSSAEPVTLPDKVLEALSEVGNMPLMVECNDRAHPVHLDRMISGLWGQTVIGDPFSDIDLTSSGMTCSGITPEHPAPDITGEKLAVRPLQIQGTSDPNTPYETFNKMATAMRSHVLTVDGPGHVQISTDNPQLGPVITEYLRTGTVNQTRIPGTDPKPER